MVKEGFSTAHDTTQAATNSQGQKNKATGGMKTYMQLIRPKGKVYFVEEADLEKLQLLSAESTSTTTTPMANFAGLVTDNIPAATATDEVKWENWITIVEEEMKTSIDWTDHSENDTVLSAMIENSFFIDSGTTIHILPYKSDFATLQPIVPKVIQGVGGSSISACRIGSIKLFTAQGNMLILQKALYISQSMV